MKGAIGNAFIMNLVITFIIIFFMLLIGSVAYSKSYKVNKFLLDTLENYVDYYNSTSYLDDGETKYLNQKNLCFKDDCPHVKKTWNERVNAYLAKSGYILSDANYSCPSVAGKDSEGNDARVDPNDSSYVLIKDTTIGDYDYCIYQKRYYEKNLSDDKFTKKRFSYKVRSYMKFDFPVVGGFLKLPIVSESKVILNFH